jgi:hypothetical protein
MDRLQGGWISNPINKCSDALIEMALALLTLKRYSKLFDEFTSFIHAMQCLSILRHLSVGWLSLTKRVYLFVHFCAALKYYSGTQDLVPPLNQLRSLLVIKEPMKLRANKIQNHSHENHLKSILSNIGLTLRAVLRPLVGDSK